MCRGGREGERTQAHSREREGEREKFKKKEEKCVRVCVRERARYWVYKADILVLAVRAEEGGREGEKTQAHAREREGEREKSNESERKCVCVCERERGPCTGSTRQMFLSLQYVPRREGGRENASARARERGREREIKKKREKVCACVCVREGALYWVYKADILVLAVCAVEGAVVIPVE